MSATALTSDSEVICCCFRRKIKEVKTTTTSVSTVAEEKSKGVPFAADLPKDFGVGKAVCITGILLQSCSRFSVNLTCGRRPDSDIAFHFNPRLQQRYVVRNSRLNGQWGDEETTSPAKFVFERNKKFHLIILLGDGEFMVSVDGAHVCSFRYRIPLEKVVGIDVQGGIDVYTVEYKKLETYPDVVPENKAVTAVLGQDRNEPDTAQTAMDTPVTFLLPAGFQQDWQLEIYGRVKILPHSFYVNLQEGSHLWPHPVIPLHLNPRFSMGTGEPLFVRNAWINGGWGQEERTPGFQFTPALPFTMAIQRKSDHFSVWIDGKLAGEFKFRGVFEKIDTVHIQGDVVIYRVVLYQTADKCTSNIC